MEKVTVIVMSTLKFEVDKRCEDCSTIKEAIERGFVKNIDGHVSLSTDDGLVCNDKQVLDEAKELLLSGLFSEGA